MLEKYEAAALASGFDMDAGQRQVAERLEQLANDLSSRGWFRKSARGVYVWGPVGRGKSWLTTVMFDSVESDRKRRLHFHDFFRSLHAACSRYRGERGAVDLAVDELLGDISFLCFDEFHVHDPGDAVLIRRLLRSLFDRNIALLTTSNYPPSGLLPNPIYHHLFEPAIDLLTEHLDVVELAGDTDYRSEIDPVEARSEFENGWYLWPGDDRQLAAIGLDRPKPGEAKVLNVNGRSIHALADRDDLVWFDFHQLCDSLTSTVDYLALAERFPRWVLSGLPVLHFRDRESCQRFANVIDVLVDRDLRLVLTAEAPLRDVLRSGTLPIDVDRMISRLSLLTVRGPADEPDRVSVAE